MKRKLNLRSTLTGKKFVLKGTAVIISGLTIASTSAAQSVLVKNTGTGKVHPVQIGGAPSREAMLQDILEATPLLQRNHNGHLEENWLKSAQVQVRPPVRNLIRESVKNVNALIDSGEVTLDADLGLTRRNDVVSYANSNYFWLRWWGYEAGLSSYVIDEIGAFVGYGGGATFSYLHYRRGWTARGAALGAGLYLVIYYAWIWSVDRIGGRRGVTFTATWPNVYMPLVWYQR